MTNKIDRAYGRWFVVDARDQVAQGVVRTYDDDSLGCGRFYKVFAASAAEAIERVTKARAIDR